jgi:hypothetical protein
MSTLSQMGIPAGGTGILQPKQRNKYQVVFTGFSSLVPSANGRDFTRQLVTFARPSVKNSKIAIHRYNSTAYIAGKYEFDPINLKIEDDVTGLGAQALIGQWETQQRLLGGDLPGDWINSAATGSDYKFGAQLQMLDGNEGIVEQWNLEGCWFESLNFGDLDYASSDSVTIDVVMSFDMASLALTGSGYGTALGGFYTT